MKQFAPDSAQPQPGREQDMTPAPEYLPRYPGADRLKGKVALITGGDSGIGRAVAVLFAREGADVAILYLEETQDAEETCKAVEAEGGRCLAIAGDIAKPEVCTRAVQRVIDSLGRLDILVNHAAEQHPQSAPEDIGLEQVKRTFATNVFGYFAMTEAALPHLMPGSAIINTSSVTAYRGSHHLIDYSATRGAIVAFTRSLSKALLDRQIRVNAVAPGPIWTPLIPGSFPEEALDHFGKGAPMGRAGQPNEVAPSHLFLACEDASYMTGQVLHPNGGESVGG